MRLKTFSVALALAGLFGFGSVVLADDDPKSEGELEQEKGGAVLEQETETQKEKTRIQHPEQGKQGGEAQPQEQPQPSQPQQPSEPPKAQPEEGQPEQRGLDLEREEELNQSQGEELDVEPEAEQGAQEQQQKEQGQPGMMGEQTGQKGMGAQKVDKEQLKTIQQKLKDGGYYQGAIDGLMGPQTKSAIRKFQQAKGLPVTGKLDPQTAQAIGTQGS